MYVKFCGLEEGGRCTGGRILSGQVGTGMCGLDRLPFQLSDLLMPLFHLKIGLDIGRICDEFFL